MRWRHLQIIVVFLVLSALPSFAASPECALDPRSSACALDHTLHLLYWAAGALALVLIIVVSLALIVYRRNKTAELKP